MAVGRRAAALKHLLVLAVLVVAGRADLDLDPEQLRVGVDDQRADPCAEVEHDGLGADARPTSWWTWRRRAVVVVVIVVV